MKNNYDDFSQNSLRESLNFPKKNRDSLVGINKEEINYKSNKNKK